ncbi:MAG: tetratricopeptide repeat protein [Gammaproteobacteria bacterium]|nr:tetratricopeptide repeat protein [Gammaproteobacteria bacterium]
MTKNINDTINALLKQLNADSNDISTAVQLGNLYYDKREAPQAILYYQHALSLDDDQPGVRTDLGTMYWENGNVSLAELAFRKVIDKHPDFGNAYLNLGLLLVRGKNQVQEGRDLWQGLIDKLPKHAAVPRAKQLLMESYQ